MTGFTSMSTNEIRDWLDSVVGGPTPYEREFITSLCDRLDEAEARAVSAEAKLAEVWDEGFTGGFYDPFATYDRDARESTRPNPYRPLEHGDDV